MGSRSRLLCLILILFRGTSTRNEKFFHKESITENVLDNCSETCLRRPSLVCIFRVGFLVCLYLDFSSVKESEREIKVP